MRFGGFSDILSVADSDFEIVEIRSECKIRKKKAKTPLDVFIFCGILSPIIKGSGVESSSI